jgi:hypothetical protein
VTNFGLHDYASPTGYAGYYVSVIDVKLMLERTKLFLFAAGEPFGLVNRGPHGMKLSPDERTLWVNSEVYSADNTTIVPSLITFNLTSGSQAPSQIIRVPATMDKIHNFVFSPNGQDLWLQLGAQGVAKYNIASGTFSATFAAKSPSAATLGSRGLYFAPNGSLIVSGVGEVIEFSVASFPPTFIRRFWAADWVVNQFLYPTMTHNGRYIVVPSTNGQIFIINYATGSLVKRVDVFGLDPVMVVIDEDDEFGYATAARGGAVTKIDLRSGSRFGRTVEFPTGVNAGPNGLVIANPDCRVEDDRETFKVVAVLSLSPPVAGTTLPNSNATLPNGQPNGYRIKSVFEFWKENINQAGGIPFDGNSAAANVEVTYVDDFSNWALTNGLLLAALNDEDVKALFVANAYFTPSAALLAKLDETNVPLLSVYPLYAPASKRSAEESQFVEEEEDQSSLYKRQVPTASAVGYDRWVDSNNFNTEYLARFARTAAAVDGQAMTTALSLQAAAYKADELCPEDVLDELTGLDTYFFYAGVKFESTTGNNIRTATGFPVLVNNRA